MYNEDQERLNQIKDKLIKFQPKKEIEFSTCGCVMKRIHQLITDLKKERNDSIDENISNRITQIKLK